MEYEKEVALRIPHNTRRDYVKDFVTKRREWLSRQVDTKLSHIGYYSEDPKNMQGNIENLIGVSQIPLGIAGPLKINGQHAKGDFYIPLATTEGALVMTYNRGMLVLTKSGGANTDVLKDEVHVSPVFLVKNVVEATQLINWINSTFNEIKTEAEKTTKHGKLLNIEPIMAGRRVILKFSYFTGDAQGLNMINRATEAACKFILEKTNKKFLLRSNFSSIKKVSAFGIYKGQGKAVFADVTIPRKVLRLLQASPEETESYFISTLLSSTHAGMIGENAHIANGVAALFAACGQDIADVSTSHIGISMCEVTESGDLYVSTYVPNLFVGTVGGGTGLGTQRECLEILGCYGSGKVKKFAEIVGATVLAGEIAVLAALTNGTYVEAHERYGRNRPKEM